MADAGGHNVSCDLFRRGASMPGMSTQASGSSSTEQIMVPMEKEQQQQHGAEPVFHLNPTEPHSYQVCWLL